MRIETKQRALLHDRHAKLANFGGSWCTESRTRSTSFSLLPDVQIKMLCEIPIVEATKSNWIACHKHDDYNH